MHSQSCTVTTLSFIHALMQPKQCFLYEAYAYCGSHGVIKTHDSESRGQEEAGRTRDEQVSYLHVAPL